MNICANVCFSFPQGRKVILCLANGVGLVVLINLFAIDCLLMLQLLLFFFPSANERHGVGLG